jgi:hypothetical protein
MSGVSPSYGPECPNHRFEKAVFAYGFEGHLRNIVYQIGPSDPSNLS